LERIVVQPLTLERRVVPTTENAFLASGFRPFFLGASLYAAFGVPFWVATLLGRAPWRAPANPLDWHAHEMVFGFTGAVFAGFLLTAIRRWTGENTVDGWRLGALFAVWLGARALPFVPGAGRVAAAVDVAFFVGLLCSCAVPIVRSRNRRNYGFLGLLAGLTLAVAVSHANRLGYLAGDFWAVRSFGVDLVTIGIIVMTGRIVPSFTRNATEARDIADTPRYDRAAALAVVVVTVLDAFSAPQSWSAAPAGLAGVLVLARARHWGAHHTLRHPLLWILHLGHAWVAFGLMLRGLAAVMPALPASLPLHAITAGGIGLLTFGMMTRVTLGHTGRLLAVPRSVALAMGALAVAALLRVVGPLAAPTELPVVLGTAGALWSGAFAAYALRYGRALFAPRIDGLPG
jgi:uncharacterized protein involved in response to NO